MTAIAKLIDSLTTPRAILILIALYGAVFGTILFKLGQLTEISGGYGILDFDLGYDMARVHEVLGSYGTEGMKLYGQIQLLDLFNPALYSLIATVLTRLLWRGRGPVGLCLLPLLGGIGDYAENVTLFLMARSYPEISIELVSASSTLSIAKNGLLVLGMLPLLLGLVLQVMRFIQRA